MLKISVCCAILMLVSVACETAQSKAFDQSAEGDDASLLLADQALTRLLTSSNRDGLSPLLDAQLMWVDYRGKEWPRTDVLARTSSLANSDVTPQARVYGKAGVVRANRGRLQVLRVWANRDNRWQLILYQETMLATQPPLAPNASSERKDCENPCKSIPFQPSSENEKNALSVLEAVRSAMASDDARVFAENVADEFTNTNSSSTQESNKLSRVAQIEKLKKAGLYATPTPVVSMRMFDFGEAVLVVAREQAPGRLANSNARLIIRRKGRWLMLFSFYTTIQDAERTLP